MNIDKHKIIQFLNDKQLRDSVYYAIQQEFLSEKVNQDTQILAASRMSIDFLRQAFKRLELYRDREDSPKEKEIQIGL